MTSERYGKGGDGAFLSRRRYPDGRFVALLYPEGPRVSGTCREPASGIEPPTCGLRRPDHKQPDTSGPSSQRDDLDHPSE